MGQSVFILDLPDYRTAAAILPKDEERTKLERRLRKTRDEYLAQLKREGTLAAEIASVSREIGRRPDPELTSRLGCLLAQREVWPEIMQESAEAYARALAAWGLVVSRAFEDVGNAAVNAVEGTLAERNALSRRMDEMLRPEAERQVAREQLTNVMATDRPHRETIAAATRGYSFVLAALHRVFGEGVQRPGEITAAHIATFVARHRAQAGVAA